MVSITMIFVSKRNFTQVSEHYIDMPTYPLKEIYCAYITSPETSMGIRENESLAMSLARLVHYAETHPIATPFYGSKLGSQISVECRHLFSKIHSTFEEEFALVKQEGMKMSLLEKLCQESQRYLSSMKSKGKTSSKREEGHIVPNNIFYRTQN